MSNIIDEFSKYLKYFTPETLLVTEGEADQDFFCLIEGSVSIWKGDVENQDKRVKIHTIDVPGSYFGEMSWLLKEKRTASILAEDHVKVLKFPGQILPFFIKTQPKLALSICTTMAKRLKGTTNKNEEAAYVRQALLEDTSYELTHAKSLCQNIFVMLTSIQAQYQLPVLKDIIQFLVYDKLIQSGKQLDITKNMIQNFPDKVKKLVEKHYDVYE